MTTQAATLCSTFHSTRGLSKFFLRQIKDKDPFHQFEINGYQFNNAHWLVGHLAWAEANLILRSIGAYEERFDHLNQFGFGSKPQTKENATITYDDLYQTLKDIHEKVNNSLPEISDEQLQQESPLGFSFGDDKSVAMMIKHAIRHEGQHCGQISWLVKMWNA